MDSENLTPEKKSSLTPLKWIGLLLLIVILVAAAFVAGRLMNRTNQLAGPGGPILISGEGGPGEMMSFALNVIPAEELPKTQPDAVGFVSRREDNSFFIGTGEMGVIISGEVTSADGEVSKGPGVFTSGGSGEGGTEVEIVVNSDTIVYKEVTAPPAPPTSGEPPAEIQQEVAPGDIEEIGENSSLTVWGRKVGDRIIADILLYSDAMMIISPAP